MEFVGYEKWEQLYAPVPHGWVMTSNIVDCINSTEVAVRELPIFDFFEQVRLVFSSWSCTNKKYESCLSTLIGKNFQEMFVLNKSKFGCTMVCMLKKGQFYMTKKIFAISTCLYIQ